MRKSNYTSGSDPGMWETSGSLRTWLLRLDGQVATVVNVEKQVTVPTVLSGEMAGQLERIAQQMGLSTGNGVVEQQGSAPGFEPVKPGFTREAGSFRRHVPLRGARDVGE